jgi:hypothetical protein
MSSRKMQNGSRGPIPVDEALLIAKQIAEARDRSVNDGAGSSRYALGTGRLASWRLFSCAATARPRSSRSTLSGVVAPS